MRRRACLSFFRNVRGADNPPFIAYFDENDRFATSSPFNDFVFTLSAFFLLFSLSLKTAARQQHTFIRTHTHNVFDARAYIMHENHFRRSTTPMRFYEYRSSRLQCAFPCVLFDRRERRRRTFSSSTF